MKRLLCLIGIHSWQYRGTGFVQLRFCKRCGRGDVA